MIAFRPCNFQAKRTLGIFLKSFYNGRMFKKCKEHLHGVEESYFQHMFHALGYGSKMIAGGLGAIVHAFIPALCQTSASRTVAALHDELQSRLAMAKAKRDAEDKSS